MNWSLNTFLVLAADSLAGAIVYGTKDDVEKVLLWGKMAVVKRLESNRFEKETEAWKVLEANFIEVRNGMIKPRTPDYRPAPRRGGRRANLPPGVLPLPPAPCVRYENETRGSKLTTERRLS